MNFKIGQKVVCVKTHSKGLVKKGQIYTILEVYVCPSCGLIHFDVGIDGSYIDNWKCTPCGYVIKTDKWYMCYRLFRPLETTKQVSYQEIIQKFPSPIERPDILEPAKIKLL